MNVRGTLTKAMRVVPGTGPELSRIPVVLPASCHNGLVVVTGILVSGLFSAIAPLEQVLRLITVKCGVVFLETPRQCTGVVVELSPIFQGVA